MASSFAISIARAPLLNGFKSSRINTLKIGHAFKSNIRLLHASPVVNKKALHIVKQEKRYQELYGTLSQQLDARSTSKETAKGTYTIFINSARTPDEFRRAVELVSSFIESLEREDRDNLGEIVIVKCNSLGCLNLALEIFSNPKKYHISMSLPVIRRLLYCLEKKSPLKEVVAALELYKVHDLPPFTDDLVSVALILATLPRVYAAPRDVSLAGSLNGGAEGRTKEEKKVEVKEKTEVKLSPVAPETIRAGAETAKGSVQVYNMLIQHLRELLSATKPSLYSDEMKNQRKGQQGGVRDMERKWLKDCLQAVDNRLRKKDEPDDVRWLTQWRLDAGIMRMAGRRSLGRLKKTDAF